MNKKDYETIEQAFKAQWHKKTFDPNLLKSEVTRLLVSSGLLFQSRLDSTWLTLTPAGECLFKAVKRMVRNEQKNLRFEKLLEAYRRHLTELRQQLRGNRTTF